MKKLKFVIVLFASFLLCGCNGKGKSSKSYLSEEEFMLRTRSIDTSKAYSSAKLDLVVSETMNGRKALYNNESKFLYTDGTFSVLEHTENNEVVNQLEDFINIRLPFAEGASIKNNPSLPSNTTFNFLESGKSYAIEMSYEASTSQSGYNINAKVDYELVWNQFGFLERAKMKLKGKAKGFDESENVEIVVSGNYNYYE